MRTISGLILTILLLFAVSALNGCASIDSVSHKAMQEEYLNRYFSNTLPDNPETFVYTRDSLYVYLESAVPGINIHSVLTILWKKFPGCRILPLDKPAGLENTGNFRKSGILQLSGNRNICY